MLSHLNTFLLTSNKWVKYDIKLNTVTVFMGTLASKSCASKGNHKSEYYKKISYQKTIILPISTDKKIFSSKTVKCIFHSTKVFV